MNSPPPDLTLDGFRDSRRANFVKGFLCISMLGIFFMIPLLILYQTDIPQLYDYISYQEYSCNISNILCPNMTVIPNDTNWLECNIGCYTPCIKLFTNIIVDNVSQSYLIHNKYIYDNNPSNCTFDLGCACNRNEWTELYLQSHELCNQYNISNSVCYYTRPPEHIYLHTDYNPTSLIILSLLAIFIIICILCVCAVTIINDYIISKKQRNGYVQIQ